MQNLCFIQSEKKLLLKNAADFAASNMTLNNLEREIEGWAVGLRLVSQVLRSKDDQQGFLNNLHGGVHQPNTYLLQEVFS